MLVVREEIAWRMTRLGGFMAACTEDTRQAYRHRAVGLMVRCVRECGIQEADLSPILFAEWLLSLRPHLRPASWRQYRSAVACWADVDGGPEWTSAVRMLRFCDEPYTPRRELPLRTSAHKAKTAKESGRARLIRYLLAANSKWAVSAARWLVAGSITGLRETEWRRAQLIVDDQKIQLRVINAKATNGRGNGAERVLDLGALSHGELDCIRAHLETARRHHEQGTFERYQKACQLRVRVAAKKLWPSRDRRPTLYTMRHQFAADAKARGLSREEVAALMGHASRETVARHYGKKRSGQGERSRVLPSLEDVARLRQDSAPEPASGPGF